PRALAEFVLARVERDRVVRVDRQPRVDQSLIRRNVRGVRSPCRAGERGAGEREADDQRAAALEEALARELALVHEAGHHLPPFAITAAACLIAVRMRG